MGTETSPIPLEIDSDCVLTDVDRHFRVAAGPGAGKTRWLVNHIKEVLRRSKKISPVTRVACISFTNVAVHEIQRRLGPTAAHVDVSTIHSFLYRHVVKPYLHLVTDTAGKPHVNASLVDGHDEHRFSFQKFKQWITDRKQGWLFSDDSVRDKLQREVTSVRWRWNEANGEWALTVRHPEWFGKKTRELLTTDSLMAYKQLYWEEGSLDHDDVLYFSHRILNSHPLIQECLSARYRHLLIDEFQDTSQVQTQIVRWLASYGTVVCVIGDAEQSIYSFLDAQPERFVKFVLADHLDLRISDNWRSTDSIVRLLNKIRSDGLTQEGRRQSSGETVRLLVGSLDQTIAKATSLFPGETKPWFLTREHATTPQFRESTNGDGDVWEKFREIDRDRCRFMESLVTGMELARLGQIPLGIDSLARGIAKRKEVRPPLKADGLSIDRHALAVTILERLLPIYDSLKAGTVMEVYSATSAVFENHLPQVGLKKLSKGAPATFCQNTQFKDLVATIKLVDETRTVRVIHQTKGTESDAVVVHLTSDQIEALVGTEATEERRLLYVAISRARDHVVLIAEAVKSESMPRLADLGIECVTI